MSSDAATIDVLLRTMVDQQLDALHSVEVAEKLAQNWHTIEAHVTSGRLQAKNLEVIHALSHNHNLLARTVLDCGMLLEECYKEAENAVKLATYDQQNELKRSTHSDFSGHSRLRPSQNQNQSCPMRTWFYENLVHPFPSLSVRRELQRINGMSMSNINGWFSNMRRRSGWNTHLQGLADGNRVAYKHLIQGCFDGTEQDRETRQKIEDMVDYALGRARGGVGEWLTDVVGGDTIDNQSRMPSTDEIVSPPNHEKRRKIISHREHSIFRHKTDNTPIDIDGEFFELGSDDLGIPNELPATNHGWSTHPQRSFSSSSCGSTISDISAAVQEEPVFQPFYPPPFHHQCVVEGGQYGLPVSFGGPPQQYSFEPVLNRQDVLRKRTQSQAENLDASGRTAKVARFS